MLGYLHVSITWSSQKSIFYWSIIDSLDKLKENIELRYHIPPNCQKLFLIEDEECNSLTDAKFQDLYNKRFDIGVLNLNLKITDTSIDPRIVEARRQFAAQRLSIIRIHLKDSGQSNILDIDFKKELNINSTILDLKNYDKYFMFRRINKRFMYFVYENLILSEEQSLVDLYLDNIIQNGDFVDKLELRFMIPNHFDCDEEFNFGVCTHGSYFLSPHIRLFSPGIEAQVNDSTTNMKIVPPKTVDHEHYIMECLDSIGYTKVAYPLLEMYSFDVWTMKCWIKHLFDVSYENQVILYDAYNDLVIADNVILEDWGTRAGFYRFYFFLLPTSLSNQRLKPFTDNDKLNAMKRIDSIPVNVTLYKNEEDFQKESFSIDPNNGETIHECISRKYNIPLEKQLLFLNDRKINNQDLMAIQAQRVLAENLRDLRENDRDNQIYIPSPETPFELHLYHVSANDEKEPSVIINHGFGESIFCQFPMSSLSILESKEQYRTLCRLIKETHPELVPEVIYLTHDTKHDQTIKLSKQNLGKLLANCLKTNKDLALNLFLNPLNLHTNEEEICQKYDLSPEIRINFLTGQFKVDLSCDVDQNLGSVQDLKDHIYKIKGILPQLQSLYHNNTDLSNDVKLFQLLHLPSNVLNLIVKQPQEIEIKLSCTFLPNNPLVLNILETLTVLDIKVSIRELSNNIPVERMIIKHNCQAVPFQVNKPETLVNDDTPVWTLLRDEIYLCVSRSVDYLIRNPNSKVIERNTYEIRFYSAPLENLNTYLQGRYRNSGNLVHFVQKPNMNLETFLSDIGNDEVVEFILSPFQASHNERRCNIY
uniref:Ubiquitin-like domain-containing protein n=1 Tax=Clytia hemisphaerica TaxID=252671 RepID=A0A7M6DPI3_9CNID